MKKYIIFLFAILAVGLTSCNDDTEQEEHLLKRWQATGGLLPLL